MYMSNQQKTPVPAYMFLSSPSNKLKLFFNHYETPCSFDVRYWFHYTDHTVALYKSPKLI